MEKFERKWTNILVKHSFFTRVVVRESWLQIRNKNCLHNAKKKNNKITDVPRCSCFLGFAKIIVEKQKLIYRWEVSK